MLWTRVLVAHAQWLHRHLLALTAELHEIVAARQAAEYAADLDRIKREAAETDRYLRGEK